MATYYSAFSGDPNDSNLKKRLKRQGALRPSRVKPYLSNLESPIPAQIKDADEYEKFFKQAGNTYIPYAGTDTYSSHGLLALLLSMADLSPTQGGILLAQRRFALSGKIEVVRQPDPIFEMGDEPEVPDSERRLFVQFARQVTWRDSSGTPTTPRSIGMHINDNLRTCGNAYLEVVMVETLGQRAVFIDLHKPEDCLYRYTPTGADRVMAISPIWRLDYITQHPPREVPVYPAVLRRRGTYRTMIHIKTGNERFYGRPDSLSSLNYQFFEFQNSDYLNKAAYSQFAGQVFIEVEDENPESIPSLDESAEQVGYDNLHDRIEQNVTNKADDLQSVVVSVRPYGSKPAYIFQFAPNTNENWYAVTNQEAERQILKSHGFPRRLVGMEEASGLSSNIVVDVMRTYSPTLFRELQESVEKPINLAYQLAADWLGASFAEDLSIRFTSPYKRMVEEEMQRQIEQEELRQQSANGNQDNTE